MIKDLKRKYRSCLSTAKATWWTMPKSTLFGRREKGFSLIEMVVVVGSFGMIIVAVISTILLTFRSQNNVNSNNKLKENGASILMELRRNIFNGDSKNIICGVGGTSVFVKNRNDLGETNLVCVGGRIASVSATTVYLNSNEVSVFNCQNFAVCTKKIGTSEVIGVDFAFGLGTTTVGVSSTQFFDVSVTTRN